MVTPKTTISDDYDDPFDASEQEEPSEDDLWFLPGPIEAEDDLPPGPRAEQGETTILADWRAAEAGAAAHLARVAGRLGALQDRLQRGPAGWRHRLALIEAAELSWIAGQRVGADRLALWTSLRLAGVQEDQAALARIGWAVRRLRGGPGPMDGLADFLDRRDPENIEAEAERFEDRAEGWMELMQAAGFLHPITRACVGYHLWSLAGLAQLDDRIEAAVTAARMASTDGSDRGFVPLAIGGAGGLRAAGPPPARLRRWLDGMEVACLSAMRHLDDIENWSQQAAAEMADLSGKTPPALRRVLREWPLVSAPMAEKLTGASRAAIQRNLIWMQSRGLIQEVTGQGRFRMWRARV